MMQEIKERGRKGCWKAKGDEAKRKSGARKQRKILEITRILERRKVCRRAERDAGKQKLCLKAEMDAGK